MTALPSSYNNAQRKIIITNTIITISINITIIGWLAPPRVEPFPQHDASGNVYVRQMF